MGSATESHRFELGMWEPLIAAGLPLGAVRPSPRPPLDRLAVRAAVEHLVEDPEWLSTAEAEPVLAWLDAFRHHWRDAYTAVLGEAGEACRRRLDGLDIDPNRFLKLRRIAIAHLSRLV